MGCDIHIIAEVKQDGQWRLNTDPVFPNPYYNPQRWKEKVAEWKERLRAGKITQEEFDIWVAGDESYFSPNKEFVNEPSSSRNYDWFAILANVRNGRGFAGISTGAGFNVIAKPRDYPDDLSDEAWKEFSYKVVENPDEDENENEDWSNVDKEHAKLWEAEGCSKWVSVNGLLAISNPDYHSASWLKIEDFNNFDWNAHTMLYGVISIDQYRELRDTNQAPESYSGAVAGRDIKTVDMEQADQILDNPDPSDTTRYYVKYRWTVNYRQWFDHNIKSVVEPLRKLSEKYEDARLVFAFDN